MLLSLVIPCYNEEAVLEISLNTLLADLKKFGISDYEIICVDDGSRDRTFDILQRYGAEHPQIKTVSFAANRGQQTAFYAGMCYSSGDAVILMDADLQDPPALIPAMLEQWKEGYQVVYGKRLSRAGESPLKRFTAYAFYRLLNSLSYTEIPQDVGEFRLMDRAVVDVVIHMEEHNRFNRALVSWLGFKQCELPFERPERAAGETKFGWKDMVKLAKDGMFAFSYFPIHFIQFMGWFSVALSFGLLAYTLVVKFTANTIPGWSSLMIVMVFFFGAILLALGIIGEYLARIHTEVMKRPLFVASRTLNLKGKTLPPQMAAFHKNGSRLS